MSDLVFFRAPSPLTLAAIAAEGAAHLPAGIDPSRAITAAAPLDRAGPADVALFFDALPIDDLRATRAGACFVAARHLDHVPRGTVALVTDNPRDAFTRLAAMLHPPSVRPASAVGQVGIAATAIVHRAARLETGVTIDPGAIVGPEAEIGAETFVGAHCVIGPGVRIGRRCAIDAQASICHALIGDDVVIHAGVRIGQAGPEAPGRRAQPRLGRVIIQNGVEIGANASVDRGMLCDTMVGEGSRIEALAAVAGGALVARDGRVAQAGRGISVSGGNGLERRP